MDERTKLMIETYLPNPPDETLEDGEFYFLQETMRGPRVIRVYPLDIMPMRDHTEYGIYQKRGANLVWVDGRGDGDHYRGVSRHDLYDNRQDCKDRTHNTCDDWEDLRRIQMEAMSHDGV